MAEAKVATYTDVVPAKKTVLAARSSMDKMRI